jgi:hypothetical protein
MMIQDCELQAVINEELLGANGGRMMTPLWPRIRRAIAKAGVEGRRDQKDHRQIHDMSELLLMVE